MQPLKTSKTTAPQGAKAATASGGRAAFDKVATSKQSRRNDYLQVGHYLGRINRFFENEGNDGRAIIAELTIVHVFPDSTPAINNQTKQAIPCNFLGQEVGDVIKESNKAYGSRVKGLIDAAMRTTEADWAEKKGALVVEAIDEEVAPLVGRVVEMVVRTYVKEPARKKPANELVTGVDTIPSVEYRPASFATVASLLTEEHQAKFFPDLADQVAAESADET